MIEHTGVSPKPHMQTELQAVRDDVRPGCRETLICAVEGCGATGPFEVGSGAKPKQAQT